MQHPAKQVLVVEDETYLRDLIADVLEAEGHTVTQAANGVEALQCLQQSVPDLVLLDLMMPVMDGWELMAALHRDERFAEIPVVLITAIYDVQRTAIGSAARAVITKPFDIDQVAEVVRLYAH